MSVLRVLALALLVVASTVPRRRPPSSPIGSRPSMAAPIETLGREVLRKRSADIFPNAYATLLSIVQGVALAAVLARAAMALKPEEAGTFTWWLILIETTATAVCVAVVYFNYVWFLLFFRWPPGPLDTLIPLGLGTSQFILANSVGDHRSWMWTYSVLYFVGAGGFAHTRLRSHLKEFEDPRDHAELSSLLETLTLTAVMGGMASAASAAFWPVDAGALALAVMTLVFAAFIVALGHHRITRIYRRWGL